MNMVAPELTQQLIDEHDMRSAAVQNVQPALPVERRRRIRLIAEPGRTSQYARITVTTMDGHSHTAEGDTHVPPPTTRNEWLTEKDRGRLSAQRLLMVEEMEHDLEHISVPDLMDRLR